jgi:hypothetical protein
MAAFTPAITSSNCLEVMRLNRSILIFLAISNVFTRSRALPELHNSIGPAVLRPFSTALFSAVLAEGEGAPVVRNGWNDRRSPQLWPCCRSHNRALAETNSPDWQSSWLRPIVKCDVRLEIFLGPLGDSLSGSHCVHHQHVFHFFRPPLISGAAFRAIAGLPECARHSRHSVIGDIAC